MIDLIIGIVVVAILALAIGYIVRAKRRGVQCIGCSCGGSTTTPSGCSGGCSGCSGSCGESHDPT